MVENGIKIDKENEIYYIDESNADFNQIIPELDRMNCLPEDFDYQYFRNVLKVLCSTDNHQVLLTTICLIYDFFEVFQGKNRLPVNNKNNC